MAWRGQLWKNLKELRIFLCQTARAFVEKNCKDLKALNPRFFILIRECGGIEPQLWARYVFGLRIPEFIVASFQKRLQPNEQSHKVTASFLPHA